MTYKIVSIEHKDGGLLWGTFSNDKDTLFKFIEYIIRGVNDPSKFYIVEVETNRGMKLTDFYDKQVKNETLSI